MQVYVIGNLFLMLTGDENCDVDGFEFWAPTTCRNALRVLRAMQLQKPGMSVWCLWFLFLAFSLVFLLPPGSLCFENLDSCDYFFFSFPVLLEGSPGVGKTSLIVALGKYSGHKVIRINLSEQVSGRNKILILLP